MELTCTECGYVGTLDEFYKGNSKEKRKVTINGKEAIQEIVINKFKCPKCNTEKTNEAGGAYEYVDIELNKDDVECEECGKEISEEEYNEFNGMCKKCYKKINGDE